MALFSGTQTQLPPLALLPLHYMRHLFLSLKNLSPISFSQHIKQNCSGSLQSLLRSGSTSNSVLQYLIFYSLGYLGSHFLPSPILAAFIASLANLSLISYISPYLSLFFLSANFFIMRIFFDASAL